MKPTITDTGFGWIEIEGERVSHDILIRLNGEVKKRKKKLSKEIYGTSHTISLVEAEYIYQEGAALLLIGGGQFGRVQLSEEAARFFETQGMEVLIQKTPRALKTWNDSPPGTIGLFHITC